MKKINIKVLGSGCPSCQTLYNNVQEIAQQIDPNLTVEYTTDITKIIELGIMSSPVFIINEEIVSVGKVPDKQTIKTTILEKLES